MLQPSVPPPQCGVQQTAHPAHSGPALPSPQDVFTFEHPNRAHCIDNTRSIRLVFECTPPAGTGSQGGFSLRGVTWLLQSAWAMHTPWRLDFPPSPLSLRTQPNSTSTPAHSPCPPTPLPAPRCAVCHGFAGYFDAQLYKDVHLSIHPPTHTPNMFSWFPIYFPLRTPFYVPQGGWGLLACMAQVHPTWG